MLGYLVPIPLSPGTTPFPPLRTHQFHGLHSTLVAAGKASFRLRHQVRPYSLGSILEDLKKKKKKRKREDDSDGEHGV